VVAKTTRAFQGGKIGNFNGRPEPQRIFDGEDRDRQDFEVVEQRPPLRPDRRNGFGNEACDVQKNQRDDERVEELARPSFAMARLDDFVDAPPQRFLATARWQGRDFVLQGSSRHLGSVVAYCVTL
jgi:hypothetical protein